MKAVFLDRDGVINVDRPDYVKNTQELNIYPYFPSSVKKLNELGFCVFVVSNQQGVAKGLYTRDNVLEIEAEIKKSIDAVGARIEEFFYCMHHASDNCSCRKPKTGMALEAAKKYGIDTKKSFVIGDTIKDVGLGHNIGAKTILVLTGQITSEEAARMEPKPDFIVKTLEEGVKTIDSLLAQKVHFGV